MITYLKKIEFNCIPRTNYKFISFSVKFPYKPLRSPDSNSHLTPTSNSSAGLLSDNVLASSHSPHILFFEIRFLDSMQFISGSLDAISKNYSNDFKITRSHFPPETWNLISQKGVLPYNYLDNFEKLNETKLPNIEEFFDIDKLKHCSQEDYDKANQIWNMFQCKTIKDYLAIYLKCDVLILADIIECFRNMCLQYYGLDPVYYYTSPNFFWDAELKITGVKLELLTSEDSEIMLMFENAKKAEYHVLDQLNL